MSVSEKMMSLLGEATSKGLMQVTLKHSLLPELEATMVPDAAHSVKQRATAAGYKVHLKPLDTKVDGLSEVLQKIKDADNKYRETTLRPRIESLISKASKTFRNRKNWLEYKPVVLSKELPSSPALPAKTPIVVGMDTSEEFALVIGDEAKKLVDSISVSDFWVDSLPESIAAIEHAEALMAALETAVPAKNVKWPWAADPAAHDLWSQRRQSSKP